VGPLRFFGRIAALFSPVPVKQPDWYILQHEQVHFAIMEVAARQLSRQLGQLSPERRRKLTDDGYQLTLSHARDRHVEFDSERPAPTGLGASRSGSESWRPRCRACVERSPIAGCAREAAAPRPRPAAKFHTLLGA
jgi:hypothetical protein